MKHLLCEHQNTISELGAERIALAEVLQNEQNQLEEELYKEMKNILVDMRTSKNEEVARELQLVRMTWAVSKHLPKPLYRALYRALYRGYAILHQCQNV